MLRTTLRPTQLQEQFAFPLPAIIARNENSEAIQFGLKSGLLRCTRNDAMAMQRRYDDAIEMNGTVHVAPRHLDGLISWPLSCRS
jgi:hypothetical protein